MPFSDSKGEWHFYYKIQTDEDYMHREKLRESCERIE